MNAILHRIRPTLAVFAALLLSADSGLASQPDESPSIGAVAHATAAGQVMTDPDRSRLRALAERREREKGGAGYRIGPDDLLQVRIPDLIDSSATRNIAVPSPGQGYLPVVAQAPVFQEGLRVDAAGNITLPLVGSVSAERLTPAELEEAIATRLRQAGILRSPQVSVQLAEYRSRVVAVVGSVERPGLYPLTRPGATMSDMVWAAGGPTKEAGRLVEFAPGDDGATDAEASGPIRVDLQVLLQASGTRERSLDPPVRAGDVITLSPAGSVLVDGWVGRPGSYPVTRGLTLSGAVAAAGGDLFPANRRRVTLARADGASVQPPAVVDLDAISAGRMPDVPITDGDVIHLPASPALLLPWGIWTLVRDLVRLGGTVGTL